MSRNFTKRRGSDGFRVGRTLAGDVRQERIAELERTQLHKQKRRKNAAIRIILTIAILVVASLVAYIVAGLAEQRQLERETELEAAKTPTVEIVDENRGDKISSRVSEFVAQLEDDASDYGLVVAKVVLPLQKAREIHVYLKGYNEYYKTTIDRDSAVQAEDMARMAKYLRLHEITCEYVDLRVDGKAYYK